MDWEAFGAIAGSVSAGAAVIGLVLQARRGKPPAKVDETPGQAVAASLASTPEAADSDALSRWAEWAWDHGTPQDQQRAREVMGYGEQDPRWSRHGKS